MHATFGHRDCPANTGRHHEDHDCVAGWDGYSDSRVVGSAGARGIGVGNRGRASPARKRYTEARAGQACQALATRCKARCSATGRRTPGASAASCRTPCASAASRRTPCASAASCHNSRASAAGRRKSRADSATIRPARQAGSGGKACRGTATSGASWSARQVGGRCGCTCGRRGADCNARQCPADG
jgi:hypothetical protein